MVKICPRALANMLTQLSCFYQQSFRNGVSTRGLENSSHLAVLSTRFEDHPNQASVAHRIIRSIWPPRDYELIILYEDNRNVAYSFSRNVPLNPDRRLRSHSNPTKDDDQHLGWRRSRIACRTRALQAKEQAFHPHRTTYIIPRTVHVSSTQDSVQARADLGNGTKFTIQRRKTLPNRHSGNPEALSWLLQ